MEEEALKEEQEQVAEPVTEKKTRFERAMEWSNSHPRTVFWIRFALWTIFACVLPFIFIAWRFQLFQPITQIQIGGWGIIAIVIVAVFALAIIRYIRLALSAKYSFIGQCLTGLCKVILPLVIVWLIVYSVKSNVDLFLQVMGVVIACEAIAIPINPLPKWAYESQKNVRAEERTDTMDYLLSGFDDIFNKDKDKDKSE